MNIDRNIVNDDVIIIGLGIIALMIVVLTVISIVLLVKNNKLKKNYNKFMSGFYEDKDIEEVLDTLVEQTKYQETKTIDFGKRLAKIENNTKFMIQKSGIIRYKAFENKGGDQSFSLCLLDNKDNGFVITSIYNDGLSSVYGKEIKAGKSDHRLSEEELKALEIAVKFSEKNTVT